MAIRQELPGPDGYEFAAYSCLLKKVRSRRERMALMRGVACADLYFLAKEVLGYSWLLPSPHAGFCRMIGENGNMSVYLLAPRCGKTTLFTIAAAIQAYLNRPTEPVLIVCDTMTQATAKVREIREHLEHNERLRGLFPERVWINPKEEAPEWNDEALIMPDHPFVQQEPSFMAASLEELPTGFHFPVILCDDLVTPANSATPALRELACEAYGLLRSSILRPGGTIRLVGTPCGEGGLYERLMQPGSGYTGYRMDGPDDRQGVFITASP